MRKIYYNDSLIGIIIKGNFKKGTTPQTGTNEVEESLGLLTFNYNKGEELRPHSHKPRKRVTKYLQECFIILKGKVKIDLYSQNGKKFKSIILKEKEAFIALSGGHGFKILEDTLMLELKNGPFIDDKVYF